MPENIGLFKGRKGLPETVGSRHGGYNLNLLVARDTVDQVSQGRVAAKPPKFRTSVDTGAIPFPRLRPVSPDDDVPMPAPDQPDASTSELPKLMSYGDLEALFGRTKRSLRRWIVAGHLVPIRVGAAVFFDQQQVRGLLSARVAKVVLERALGRRHSISRKTLSARSQY